MAFPCPDAGSPDPRMHGMPRAQIAFCDRILRLFDGRGAVSIRDQGLTGLQTLQSPPIEVRNYRFFLVFGERGANILIRDLASEVYDYNGCSPLFRWLDQAAGLTSSSPSTNSTSKIEF